jgi:hypothetical protein
MVLAKVFRDFEGFFIKRVECALKSCAFMSAEAARFRSLSDIEICCA